MLNGLMHECMNMIKTIGKNVWGTKTTGNLALSSILELPYFENYKAVNIQKHNYCAWLQFLDVVRHSLVLAAVAVESKLSDIKELNDFDISQQSFGQLCDHIAHKYIVAAPTALEADGIKTKLRDSLCGNAVLLSFDLMSMREM
ncbi:hypothetical protein PM082_017714 [Marasmius tenuissimus]|nr:hypothetical protein PM082_017714 [Marasmius tenuissimus]